MGRNMEDNYLKLFGNMFYNIKEDQDNKKLRLPIPKMGFVP